MSTGSGELVAQAAAPTSAGGRLPASHLLPPCPAAVTEVVASAGVPVLESLTLAGGWRKGSSSFPPRTLHKKHLEHGPVRRGKQLHSVPSRGLTVTSLWAHSLAHLACDPPHWASHFPRP